MVVGAQVAAQPDQGPVEQLRWQVGRRFVHSA
jgi:hypothetical protein